MKKLLILLLCALTLLLCGCGLWGEDATTKDPQYHPMPGEEGVYTFTLELRLPTNKTETADGDAFPHSTADGELVAQWTVPVYGVTLYESVTEFCKTSKDKFTFRLSQHRFYMFHDCTLANGDRYELETCYIAVDGEYGWTANFQSLLGKDGAIGTADDVKTVTIVYKGWFY